MGKRRLLAVGIPFVMVTAFAMMPAQAGTAAGVGVIPQGAQTDAGYEASYKANHVANVDATTQKVSCYRPEVPLFTSNGPNDGYTGMQPCPGATTGENTGSAAENPGTGGIYPSQVGSAVGYPADKPMVVNDHSESDLRVDPKNPMHIIASSKWFASAEGYNHVLGFYESLDGGKTWPYQGHIPGYEGFTDNTDPVGAFDGFGDYYEFILPYQFAYVGGATGTGSKLFQKSNEPNPALPSEATTVSVRPAGAVDPKDWITTHKNKVTGITGPDYIEFDDNQGNEPDKQWIAIDHYKYLPDGKTLNPNYNTIYAMFVNFSFAGKMSKAYISTAKALPGGQHTDWTPIQRLPSLNASASDTYLLPHVDPNGVVWTSITNFPSRMSRSTASIGVDFSTDGGVTWQGPLATPAQNVQIPPLTYANTTFTDGIEDTFTVGSKAVNRVSPAVYPLYVSWEDFSAGNVNILVSGSLDGGRTWSAPIQVNDNASPVDEFQPNLAANTDGTVSVNFYDRRLACPTSTSSEAGPSGIRLDQQNPNYAGSLPPYGAGNYCVNTSIQFYSPTLQPIGNNIRLSQHTWDPQLNSPDRFGSTTFTGKDTFIGDYFGNDFAGTTSLTTSVSTFDDGTNPLHFQQQIVAIVAEP
jgi:hypothetical protein